MATKTKAFQFVSQMCCCSGGLGVVGSNPAAPTNPFQ
jgi:hypothetical protein